MNAIELAVFNSRMAAVCEEMGAILQGAAFSPNIKDRLDFSCAIFDAEGGLCAQAAHIPVHLGSMAFAMNDIAGRLSWQPGDMVVVNDPYLGGTHLPDVTVISPVYAADTLMGFVASRAHHANIGAESPGSMPISDTLEQEGMIIPPTFIVKKGVVDKSFLTQFANITGGESSTYGDFSAQMSANNVGTSRLSALVDMMGNADYLSALTELNNYGERLARQTLQAIPDGDYHFVDVLDDDGKGTIDVKISVNVSVQGDRVSCDFSGSDKQVKGNINCPVAVVAAAVYYIFRCLMPDYTPACAGTFRPIDIHAPEGSLLNAVRPAAVAAGNVETSTRIVDVVLGALAQAIPDAIPAASHGSMNNVAMGLMVSEGEGWDYYETIGGGMGGNSGGPGLSAVHTHMTNTLNTPIESLEMHYPLRILRYAIRQGSGGIGQHPGGDGVIRTFEFLAPAQVTLLTERRSQAPWGLQGGGKGAMGRNLLNDKKIAGKVAFRTNYGDKLQIETAGGGGWGKR